MFNSGLILSKIDGSENIYEHETSRIPLQFSYMKNLPPVLDQGSDPICVPCSISAWCEYKLILLSGVKNDSNFRLYDIFESRKNNSDDGMNCKDAFDYIIKYGAKYNNGIIHASKYYIIKNTISLRNAIINNGPCILVLPVYNDQADDFWVDNGDDLIGYHAVSVVGYDTNGFIIRNSWSDTYGYDGYMHISDNDVMKKAIECWTLI